MKNTITTTQVKHIAKLASLDITDEEAKKYQVDLNNIVEFMEEIKKLDLKSIPETSRTTDEENVFRSDDITPSLTQEEALSNAKNTHKGFFLIPDVLAGKKS